MVMNWRCFRTRLQRKEFGSKGKGKREMQKTEL
jgi:hypothetical protein